MSKGRKRYSRRTAEGTFDDADAVERNIVDPACDDDPRWLGRIARKLRAIAGKKEKAREHKENQRSGGHGRQSGRPPT